MKKAIVMCALMLTTGLAQADNTYRLAALKQARCGEMGNIAVQLKKLKATGMTLSQAQAQFSSAPPVFHEVLGRVYRLDVPDSDTHALGWAACMDGED